MKLQFATFSFCEHTISNQSWKKLTQKMKKRYKHLEGLWMPLPRMDEVLAQGWCASVGENFEQQIRQSKQPDNIKSDTEQHLQFL